MSGRSAVDPRTLVVIKTHSFAHDRDWLNVFLGRRASVHRPARTAGAGRRDARPARRGRRRPRLRAGRPEPRRRRPRTDRHQHRQRTAGRACTRSSRDTCARRGRPSMPSERTGAVAGVVLAAGTSTRMGRNKLFMELEGKPLVRRVVGRASKAGFDPLIVVLGHEADLVQRALEGIPYQPVINPEYERGVNSSLRAGIQAASETPAPRGGRRARGHAVRHDGDDRDADRQVPPERRAARHLGLRRRQRPADAVRPVAVWQSSRCRKARAAASTS